MQPNEAQSVGMRTLVFGDLHLSERAEWSRTGSSGMPEILELGAKTLEWLEELAVGQKVERVVFLGDLFTQGARLSGMALQVAVSGFETLGFQRECIAVVGNHDLVTRDGAFNSLAFLRLCNFQVVRLWTHNDEFGYLPYSVNLKEIELSENGPRVVFAHQAVTGGLLRPGMRDKRDVHEGDLLEGPELVLLGHYHHPETRGNGRLIYVGSPMHHHWGDAAVDIPRGAVILHGTSKVERFFNPFTPRFITVDLKDERPSRKKSRRELEKYDPSLQVILVKIRYTPSRLEDAKWLKKKFAPHFREVRLEQVSTTAENPIEESVVTDGAKPRPPNKILRSWVKNNPPPGSKKKAFQVGQEIVESVVDG